MNEGALDKIKRETDQLCIIPAGHHWLEHVRACAVWDIGRTGSISSQGLGMCSWAKAFLLHYF